MMERRVCDHCRRRKAKCDRGYPCSRCRGLRRDCTYTDVLRKRGPKFVNLYPHVLTTTFHSHHSSDGSSSQALFSLSSNSTTELSGTDDSTGEFDSSSPGPLSETELAIPKTAGLLELSHARLILDSKTTNGAVQGQGIVPSSAMVRILHLYIKHLYPLMPVFDTTAVLESLASNPRGLAPQRYSFLSSLCAATQCHLGSQEGSASGRSPSAESLLADALWARTQYDIVEDTGLDALLSSFFLFVAYNTVGREKRAWFYLREAVSLALARGIHREDQYLELEVMEAEYRRRVFWTLFIAERTFCLAHDKPLVLRPLIEKPQPQNDEEAWLIEGFVRIISLFTNLSLEPPTWTATGFVTPISFKDSTTTNVTSSQKLPDLPPIQRLELVVTQHWLSGKMWKWAATRSPGTTFYISTSPWDWTQPMAIGKAVVDDLGSFASIPDSGGISLDRKLADIAECVCDVAPILHHSEHIADEPEWVLSGLLRALSRFRGGSSHLLSDLQRRSQRLFEQSA